ncbi:latent transforming growth factor beta binding like [Cryptosporidium bovis]|uniref:latent transforming growth factor beta binding like n=1 Tax=Cryptosporidium bovis TaxID=310047 RepID=UPI00351A0B50|nr:latent transforming growth factor beta binding like [Cryptosporidium bovis]
MFGAIKFNYLLAIGLILFNLTHSNANESELSSEAWIKPNTNQNNVYDSTSDEGMSTLNRKIVETQSSHKHKNKQHHHHHRHHHHKNQKQNENKQIQHQNKLHDYVYNVIHRNQTNNNSYSKTHTPDYSDSTDNEIYYVFDNNLNSEAGNNHYLHYDTQNNNVYQMRWERNKHHHLFNYTSTTTTTAITTSSPSYTIIYTSTTTNITVTTTVVPANVTNNNTSTVIPSNSTTTSTAATIIPTNGTTTTTRYTTTTTVVPINSTTTTTTTVVPVNSTTTTTTTRYTTITTVIPTNSTTTTRYTTTTTVITTNSTTTTRYTTTTTVIPTNSTTATRYTTTTTVVPTNSTTTTRYTTTTTVVPTNSTTTTKYTTTTTVIPINSSTTTITPTNIDTTTTSTTPIPNNGTTTTTNSIIIENTTTTTKSVVIITSSTTTTRSTTTINTTTSTMSTSTIGMTTTSTSVTITDNNVNGHKYEVSLVMDLSKVPNLDQMKEINMSANIIYRKLLNSGLTAELVSIPSNNTDYTHEKTNFLSKMQKYENNITVDRLLSSVVEKRRIIEDEYGGDLENMNTGVNQRRERGLNNYKTTVKRKKIVYITAGYNGCTTEQNCPGILKLKENADIYMISLSKNSIMYNEIEYISTKPTHLYSVLMDKKELKDEATHLSKWIRGEYRFNNQKYLLPKKLDKNFKNQICSKCSENANCYVHSAFEHTRDLSKFECVCSSGWMGDGIDCFDINECISLNNPCGNHHCCINTPGGFECKYTKNNKC